MAVGTFCPREITPQAEGLLTCATPCLAKNCAPASSFRAGPFPLVSLRFCTMPPTSDGDPFGPIFWRHLFSSGA